MLVNIEKSEKYTILKIEEDIVPENTDEFKNNLSGLISGNLLIDFTNCQYMCSTGLGQIASVQKKIKKASGKLILFGLNEKLKRLFEITRLSKIITINCEKQKVLCYEDIDTPIFTEDDIDEVIEHIESAEKQYLPIILTHHNLLPQKRPRIAMYTELINSGYFRERLENLNRTIIYLHGHVHDNPIEIIQSGKHKHAKIICISAPLLFPNTEFESKKFGFNGINIIFGTHGIPLGCKITRYRISEGVDKKEEERIRFISPPDSFNFATQDEIAIFNSIYKEKRDIHLVHLMDIAKKENGENFSINEIEASVDRLDWLGLVNYSPKNNDPIHTRVIKKVIPS